MNFRISIAMTTYNGSRYLREQLASFAAQTRLPDELVVCDDDSTDETIAILQEFANTAPFSVRIERNQERLGIRGNFSKAMSLCEGDIIVFSDQDDVWVPQRLEKVEAAYLTSPRVGVVISDAQIVDQNLAPMGYTLWKSVRFTPAFQREARQGKSLEVLCRGQYTHGCILSFRAEYRQYLLPIPEEAFPHDLWTSRFISAVADIAIIPECLVLYRQHPGQKVGAGQTSLVNRVNVLAIQAPVRSIERRWQKRANRFRLIKDRVEQSFPDCKDSIAFLQRHIDFLEWRGQLPSQRIWRIVPCLGALVRGEYHRHAEGLISIGKDLLQRNWD